MSLPAPEGIRSTRCSHLESYHHPTRRGHFAMGVGLEAGLLIDAMADELAELIDKADSAALSGDINELADALGGLGERLLFMRPFIP